MRTTMDAGGRVVVPKAIRTSLHLTPGAALEISARAGLIVIEPAPVAMRLTNREGALVVESEERLPALTAGMVRDTLEGVRR